MPMAELVTRQIAAPVVLGAVAFGKPKETTRDHPLSSDEACNHLLRAFVDLGGEEVDTSRVYQNGNREAVVRESADLLYHLVVLWAEAGIRPQEVWAEMDRREKLLGLAEKLPKDLPKGGLAELSQGRKVVALEARRIPKRRPSGY